MRELLQTGLFSLDSMRCMYYIVQLVHNGRNVCVVSIVHVHEVKIRKTRPGYKKVKPKA